MERRAVAVEHGLTRMKIHLTLRQAQGEDPVSNLPQHKVHDKTPRFLKSRINANCAACRCDPVTADRCLSVSIRVHPCQTITPVGSGRSLAWNGERWRSNTDRPAAAKAKAVGHGDHRERFIALRAFRLECRKFGCLGAMTGWRRGKRKPRPGRFAFRAGDPVAGGRAPPDGLVRCRRRCRGRPGPRR